MKFASFQRSADGNSYTEVATRDIGIGTTQVNFRNDALIGLAVTGGGGGSSLFGFGEITEFLDDAAEIP